VSNTTDDQVRADTPLLVVDNLKTHFKVPAGMVKAVDGVSFELELGKTLGIVGESGSGKSVLSRSVMGLNVASNAHVTGSVKYNGRELVGLRSKEIKKLWGAEMAMVFQDPMTSLNPVVKVGRQMTEHVRKHLGLSKKDARTLAVDLLRSVHIPEPDKRFENYPHQMSGGMRQRVCIAIALACGPEVLFADEPTTALDVTVQHQILNLLAEQQRERNMTMIMVTHDLGVVAGRADEIAVMYAGKIVEKAPTKGLFANMRHPYTQALFRSIPKTSQAKHSRLQAISGRPPDLISPPPGCKFAPRCPYAQEQCREEEPELTEVGATGHHFACHIPVGSNASDEAFAKNLAAELPQAMAYAGRIAAVEDLSVVGVSS